MARKGKKQEKDTKGEETAVENNEDSGSSKNEVDDSPPDSTTDDAPKRGAKRSASAKDDATPAKKKKGGVEENGIAKGNGRPKRATASKAEKEVKALLIPKKKPGKKGAAKKPATPRKEPAQFEVESIMGSRKRKGRLEYKIRWKGYSMTSDTWEPARNLKCPEILDAWKAKQQNEEKSK